jgi:hypothetical protein
MANLDNSVGLNLGERIDNRAGWIGRSREQLENAKMPVIQINAVGKGAAGINRRAQRPVLSYRSMTASGSPAPYS